MEGLSNEKTKTEEIKLEQVDEGLLWEHQNFEVSM